VSRGSPTRKAYAELSDGRQAHYRWSTAPSGNRELRGGDHRPVICLHMVPKSSRSFAQLLPALAQDRPVFAPDLPSHGASDPLAEPASIEGYAHWLWMFIDALALPQPLDLVGYHTGSMVAVAAARQRPQSVGKIINISAPAFSSAELAGMREYFQPIPLDEGGTRFTVMWQRVLHHAGPDMNLEMAAASFGDNLNAGEDYEEGHRAAFDHAAQYLRDIAAIPHPLRVMNIADDLFETTRQIDAHLNNGERRDYPQWGNGFLELHPEAVAREILAFLDSP